MLYFLIFVIGYIIGIISMVIKYKYQTIYGKISIDHYAGLISVFADIDKLKKIHNKRVVFTVDHNAVISRDEHVL